MNWYKKRKIHCWILTVWVAGCGGDGSGSGETDGNLGADGGAAAGGSGTCAGDVRFSMTGAFNRTSTDAELLVWDGEVPGILGIRGTVDGTPFVFERAGDVGDGNLGEQRTYDVASYPYNMRYLQVDNVAPGAACDSAPDACSGFLAFAGTFTVTELAPTYAATFSLSMLEEGNIEVPGTPLEGDVSGCIRVPSP